MRAKTKARATRTGKTFAKTTGVFEADVSIDLHGFHPDAAMERLRQTVDSGRYRGKALLVIHGLGRGVLRERVRDWAKRTPNVRDVWAGEERFLPGGGGVTALFL